MRLRCWSFIACGVLSGLALPGCSQPSPAPVSDAATVAAPALPPISASTQPPPAVASTRLPDCPAGTRTVEDKPNGYGRVCHGAIPTYFAQVMVRIPASKSSPEREDAWVTQDQDFAVVAGLGRRPDIKVGRHSPWIRSFEGSDPATTIYLVSGADCTEPDDPDLGCGAFSDLRAYAVTGNGIPKDVTSQVLPPSPLPTQGDRNRYLEDHGATGMFREDSRLALVPVMRAFVELDPDRPLPTSDPRSFGYVHLGFLVWNGVRFELRDKVPRSLWPCEEADPGKSACPGDRFVIGDQ